MGSLSLQHSRQRRFTLHEHCCPLRSVLRVWLPSRRFTPSKALPVLFHTGGTHGIHPSKLSPPARYPSVSAWKGPPVVYPSDIPPPKRRPARTGPTSGLRPLLESLANYLVISAAAAGCSLGFSKRRRVPDHSSDATSGLCVHLAPGWALLPAPTVLFGSRCALP